MKNTKHLTSQAHPQPGKGRWSVSKPSKILTKPDRSAHRLLGAAPLLGGWWADLVVGLGNIAKLFGCIKTSGFTVCRSGMEPTPCGKFVRVCLNLSEDNSLFQHCRGKFISVLKPLCVCGRPTIFFHENAQSNKSRLILAPKRSIIGTNFHNPPNSKLRHGGSEASNCKPEGQPPLTPARGLGDK